MSVDHRKLGLKEDWPAIPYVAFILVGMAVSAYDLIILQGLRIQLYPLVIGIVLVIVGGSIRVISRMTVKIAGFGLVNSTRLRVIEKQKIVRARYLNTSLLVKPSGHLCQLLLKPVTPPSCKLI